MSHTDNSALDPVTEAPVSIPTLREIPIHEPAAVIPTSANASILNWLEAIGRLDASPVSDYHSLFDEDGEIIDEFTGEDTDLYEDEELEDDLGDEEEEDF